MVVVASGQCGAVGAPVEAAGGGGVSSCRAPAECTVRAWRSTCPGSPGTCATLPTTRSSLCLVFFSTNS